MLGHRQAGFRLIKKQDARLLGALYGVCGDRGTLPVDRINGLAGGIGRKGGLQVLHAARADRTRFMPKAESQVLHAARAESQVLHVRDQIRHVDVSGLVHVFCVIIRPQGLDRMEDTVVDLEIEDGADRPFVDEVL